MNVVVLVLWRRCSVMGCHATTRGSILGGNGVFNKASRPSQGTVNGGAVFKWPRCRWDIKHNQPINNTFSYLQRVSKLIPKCEIEMPKFIDRKWASLPCKTVCKIFYRRAYNFALSSRYKRFQKITPPPPNWLFVQTKCPNCCTMNYPSTQQWT